MKWILVVCVLASCGDNLAGRPDAGKHADAAIDSLVHHARAIVVSGDFTATGILSTLDIDKLEVVQNAVTGVAGNDPYLRLAGNDLLIVNRSTGNNVTILDAKTLALRDQLATGTGSNPQDVAVKGNKLYVPALGTTGVVVVTRGSTATTTIDLGTPLGDPDGKPDCVSAYIVGNDLYVACDLLDSNFSPRGPGKVAIIDTTNDTFKSSVTLPYKNPQGLFVKTPDSSTFGGDLLIATVPDFQDYSTGCVARVSTAGTPTAACAITNRALAGFPTHMEIQSLDNGGALLWMAVGAFDASFNASGLLRGYDLMTGMLWSTPISPAAQLIVDVAACPDASIVVADRKMNAAGLRIYANASERTAAPIAIGLPPTFGNSLVCADK